MKIRLLGVLAALALTTSASAVVAAKDCAAICATVRCIGGYTCGLYTNSSGQTVCGCHP